MTGYAEEGNKMASAGVGSSGREAIREVRGKTVYILLLSTSRVHVNTRRLNPFLSLRSFQGMGRETKCECLRGKLFSKIAVQNLALEMVSTPFRFIRSILKPIF